MIPISECFKCDVIVTCTIWLSLLTSLRGSVWKSSTKNALSALFLGAFRTTEEARFLRVFRTHFSAKASKKVPFWRNKACSSAGGRKKFSWPLHTISVILLTHCFSMT